MNDQQNSLAPVKLMLPQVIINNFQISPNSEVVAIDGRELVTLNSNSIDSLVAESQINQDKKQLQTITTPNFMKVLSNVQPNQTKDKWGDL